MSLSAKDLIDNAAELDDEEDEESYDEENGEARERNRGKRNDNVDDSSEEDEDDEDPEEAEKVWWIATMLASFMLWATQEGSSWQSIHRFERAS